MGFYEELAKYYDEVFPIGKIQLEFLGSVIGNEPKKVIDIACGNGAYAVMLAKKGHEVLALDLSLAMIEETKKLAEQNEVQVETKVCGMLELKEVIHERYDKAFCIGNSLVHLSTIGEIETFIQEAYSVLEEKGKLIIQIINYDRILAQNINYLPHIEVKEKALEFKREYIIHESKEKVSFKTTLVAGTQELENTIDLIALRSKELVDIMAQSGFRIIGHYGDFKETPYKEDESFHCIVVGEK